LILVNTVKFCVIKVAAALLMLIKNETKDFSWENAKRMLAKVDSFMAILSNFTGEDIPPEVMIRIQPILDDPIFTYEKMKAKSMAAATLCSWVINITEFHKVYRRVKPLMEMLQKARQTKASAELELDAVESDLRKLDLKLAELQVCVCVCLSLFPFPSYK
jgi:dynein heavy chain, axonemal